MCVCVCVCAYVGCKGDTQYHFRVQCSGSGLGGTDMVPAREHSNVPLVLMVRQTNICRADELWMWSHRTNEFVDVVRTCTGVVM